MYSRVVKWESVATDYRIFIMRVSENDDLASHLLTVNDFCFVLVMEHDCISLSADDHASDDDLYQTTFVSISKTGTVDIKCE